MDNRVEILRRIKLFVLDMDGTFYLGDRIIEGSLEFLEAVKASGRRFLFFTNNSSKDKALYIEKLGRMGCGITEKDIITSGDVTIRYLHENCAGMTVYLVGTPALERSFAEAGIRLANVTGEKPGVVVLGFDTTLTYEKLERACSYIREGAVYIATHPDINCPTDGGFIPDCGAMAAAINLSTGRTPKILGKPYRETMEMIMLATGLVKEEIAFVGDRLYTDIAAGVNNGAAGLLVLSGETKRSDAELSAVRPDGIYENLYEIGTLL